MSHDYGGAKFYKIIRHEQPGTGFQSIIPITIWHQTFVVKITKIGLTIIKWIHRTIPAKLNSFLIPARMQHVAHIDIPRCDIHTPVQVENQSQV